MELEDEELVELDGLVDALGLREAEGDLEVLDEADGESEALGLCEALGDWEAEELADGLAEAEGLAEALGDCEEDGLMLGDALRPALTGVKVAFSLSGRQMATKRMRPAVTLATPAVRIIFSATRNSATVELSGTAAGVADDHILLAVMPVAVVEAIKPLVLVAVPSIRVALEPVSVTSHMA